MSTRNNKGVVAECRSSRGLFRIAGSALPWPFRNLLALVMLQEFVHELVRRDQYASTGVDETGESDLIKSTTKTMPTDRQPGIAFVASESDLQYGLRDARIL